jgi:hypothetical protein
MGRTSFVAAALAGLALSACGESSDADSAREAVKDYAAAVADGDERRACAMLARAARQQFERSKSSCEAAYRGFGRALNKRQREELREIEPEVTVNGDRATTRIDAAPFEGKLRLRKENGEWKVSPR